jgi:redox-sensing transcriptional repressor
LIPKRREEEIRVSDSTVRRLSAYYRVIGEFLERKETTVSSYDLARESGATPARVRKDLSTFGHFGKRGTGYDALSLFREIRSILGLDRKWKVGLVGAGNLAHALVAYKEFEREGFVIEAVFDNDPAKIGQLWGKLSVEPMERLTSLIRERNLAIGIIATPAAAAQEVAERLVGAGIQGILNFAPRKLTVPDHVNLRNVNLAIELEGLSFALK